LRRALQSNLYLLLDLVGSVQLPLDSCPQQVQTRCAAMIKLKRVYESPSAEDGLRVLVDRLWPRGLTKERAAVDLWAKDVAPSTELRKWFGHDPAKWKQFQIRYKKELQEKKDALHRLKQSTEERNVTLVYGARDAEHNEALVLKKVLERQER